MAGPAEPQPAGGPFPGGTAGRRKAGTLGMMGPRAAAVPVTACGRPQEGREAALRLKAFGATSLARGRPGKEAAMCVVGGGCLAVAPCQTGHCWGCWTPGHKQSYEQWWPGSWRGLRGLWGQSNVLVGGLEGPVREREGGVHARLLGLGTGFWFCAGTCAAGSLWKMGLQESRRLTGHSVSVSRE